MIGEDSATQGRTVREKLDLAVLPTVLFVTVRILALCARASTPDCSNIVQKCIKDAFRPKIESLHFGASVKNRGKLNWKKNREAIQEWDPKSALSY